MDVIVAAIKAVAISSLPIVITMLARWYLVTHGHPAGFGGWTLIVTTGAVALAVLIYRRLRRHYEEQLCDTSK